jgi:hypothetical protein
MKKANCNRKRIFVVGVPRSGTTLIQSVLNAHEDILGLPESHFYRHLFFSHKILKFLVSNRSDKNLTNYSKELTKIFGSNVYCGRSIFSNKQNKLFINYLDCIANDLEKLHWSEKTPYHLNFIPYIERHVDNVYFLHVIRDPQDTVASLFEACRSYPKIWGPRSIEECCLRWNKDIQTSLNYIDKKRHYFVRYESINTSNMIIVKDIFNFLGLDFSKFNLGDISKKSTNLIYEQEYWKSKNKQGLMNNNNSNKFYDIFSKEERNLIKGLIDYGKYEAFLKR